MKFLCSIASLMLLQLPAHAVSIKTMSQDNSAIKFNPSNAEKPGICTEVVNYLTKKYSELQITGLDIHAPLARIEQGLESGQIDAFFCLLKSPERAAKFNFNETPIYKVNHIIITKADDKVEIKDMAALKSLSEQSPVMVAQGSALAKFLESQGVKVESSTKDEVANLNKLLLGRGRFYYAQDLSALASIHEGKLDLAKFRILPNSFKEEAQYVAFSKQATAATIQKISAAIDDMKKSGELDKIVSKYQK